MMFTPHIDRRLAPPGLTDQAPNARFPQSTAGARRRLARHLFVVSVVVLTVVCGGLFPADALAQAQPRPCSEAHIHITRSGLVWLAPTKRAKDRLDPTFCLDTKTDATGARGGAVWTSPKAYVSVEDVAFAVPLVPYQTFTGSYLTSGHQGYGYVRIRIEEEDSTARDVLIQRFLDLANADTTFAHAHPNCVKPEGVDTYKKAAAAVLADKKITTVPITVFEGVIPVGPGPRERISMDALDGPSSIDLDLEDGAGIDVFAFNIAREHPQDVEVLPGSPVVRSPVASELAKIVATIVPSTAPLLKANSAPVPAPACDDPGPALTAYYEENCKAPESPCKIKLSEPTAVYTSVRVSKTVVGGYNYAAQVCADAQPASRATNDSQQPKVSKACTGATPNQITASVAFKTHAVHPAWGVGVELGWDFSARRHYDMSGYSFDPVSQGGPDQLYQLQGHNRAVDHTVVSALLLYYPYRKHFGLGLGPSFWRGTGSEAFHQWNIRGLYEVTDGVLFSFGPSWRNYDAPILPLGTLESVPKPATPPTIETRSQWTPMLTVGLTIDLGVASGGAVSAFTGGNTKTGDKQ